MKRENILNIVLICISLVGVGVFVTYAFLAQDFLGIGNQVISTGVLDVTFTSETNVISLNNALPIMDSDAIAGYTPYTFNVQNNSGVAINYNLHLVPVCCDGTATCTEDRIDANVLKYKIINTTSLTDNMGINPTNNLFLSALNLSKSTDANYVNAFQLQVWISNEATNDDLYVKEDGTFINDDYGDYVGKVFCAKVEAIVETAN